MVTLTNWLHKLEMQWELYGTHGRHNGQELQPQEDNLVVMLPEKVIVNLEIQLQGVTTTTTRRQRRSGVNTRVVAQIDRSL